MMNSLTGLRVAKSQYASPGVAYVSGDMLFVGPPRVSKEIYEIFHQGNMLKWYDYIGEGPGSIQDTLFGWSAGSLYG